MLVCSGVSFKRFLAHTALLNAHASSHCTCFAITFATSGVEVSPKFLTASSFCCIWSILKLAALSAVAHTSFPTIPFSRANFSGVIPVALSTPRFVARSIFHWLDRSHSATEFPVDCTDDFTESGMACILFVVSLITLFSHHFNAQAHKKSEFVNISFTFCLSSSHIVDGAR